MKKRNAIVIISSVVIFVIAAALLYRYLFPPSPDSQVKVIIPHPVDSNFNQEQLDVLKNDVVDFSQNISPSDGQTSSQTQNQQPNNQSLNPIGGQTQPNTR